MEFKLGIDEIQKLVCEKRLEVQDGVYLCADEGVVKPTLYGKDNNLVIEFEAPFPYVYVTKLGPKKLANLVKPRVEKITVKPKTFVIELSTLGEMEIER